MARVSRPSSTLTERRPAEKSRATAVRVERLRPNLPNDGWFGWGVTAIIALVAFILRVLNLGYPNKLLFDETYYAKDAWALTKYGYETEWAENANDQIPHGDLSALTDQAAKVMHPPLGKWMIGLGEGMFGMTSFGWRFMSVLFGVLIIVLVIRMTRRLTGSLVVGALAGILLMFDGLHFVMSRLALLDIFQTGFTLAAVAALLVDRDWYRERLARHLEQNRLTTLGGTFGPIFWWRPWRLVAGIMFGLGCGTKWSTLYVLAAFSVLSVLWDVGARRLAGAGPMAWKGLVIDGPIAFGYQVVVAVLVYIASWTGWFVTGSGYKRQWSVENPDEPLARLGTFGSWLSYHAQVYSEHTGDYMRHEATHSYDAHPSGWLVIGRPTGVDAVNGIKPGTDGCPGPEDCIRVISAIGTPILWWAGVIAFIIAVAFWIGNRDWRFGVPVLGLLSVWLPWFPQADRPLYFFYTIMIIPFTCMALAMVLGKLIGENSTWRPGVIITGVFVALVIINFGYFHPILTDGLLTRTQWQARMWFNRWI